MTGQVFRYGIAHGIATRSPARDIRPGNILKSTRKSNYARIEARDLPDLLRRIEVYQGTHVTRLLAPQVQQKRWHLRKHRLGR